MDGASEKVVIFRWSLLIPMLMELIEVQGQGHFVAFCWILENLLPIFCLIFAFSAYLGAIRYFELMDWIPGPIWARWQLARAEKLVLSFFKIEGDLKCLPTTVLSDQLIKLRYEWPTNAKSLWPFGLIQNPTGLPFQRRGKKLIPYQFLFEFL